MGLIIVALADITSKDTSGEDFGRNSIITGDLLIVLAQIITSVQMVIEEKFVHSQDIPPLQAVGWEGKILIILGISSFLYIYHLNFVNVLRGTTCFHLVNILNIINQCCQLYKNYLIITSVRIEEFVFLEIGNIDAEESKVQNLRKT